MFKSIACSGVFLLIVLLNTTAMAGGIILYETATPDMGTASAGYAARAQDAATVLSNPAGMARLDDSELMVGVQGLYGDLKFSPNADTTVSGSDGGNPVGFLPGMTTFYVNSHSKDLKFGIGMYSNFGLAYEYDSDWVGRYKTTEGALLGISILPSVSYRLNEQFSIGAGVNCMYGYYKMDVAVNNLQPGAEDGKLEIEDDTFGFGANIGLLYELCESTRLGLTYTSEIDLDFADTPKFTNIGPVITAGLNRAGLIDNKLDLDMTVPQTVMASFYHSLNEKTAVLGNVGWQDWSEFGKIGIEVKSEEPTSLTANRNYDDTWHGALGVQYRVSKPVLLSCGVGYDSSIVEDKYRTADLPSGEVWRFGIGSTYQCKENIELGCAYTLGWSGDMKMDQEGLLSGDVVGTYKHTALHFLTFNVRWKF
jgi:long-chain fatty acid transport protein